MGLFGYDGSAVIQSPGILRAVRIGFGILPGIFFLLTALVLQVYGISREVYLQARRSLSTVKERSS